jgi:hypothetical protein
MTMEAAQGENVMETGIEPGRQKSVFALLVTAWTLGWAFFGAMMLYKGHVDPPPANSHALAAMLWWVPRVAAVLVVPMSLLGMWLCRRARADTESPMLNILVGINVMVLCAAGVYLGYVFLPGAGR